jgi:Transglycosylase-like domain
VLDHPTAGYGIVIRDAEGWEYHIYHVNNDTPGTDDGGDDGTWRFATGIGPGVPVQAGELLAWMGDSGNSEGSVPHAHVELHRPDGTAINPYWSLRQAQRDVNCAAAPTGPDATQPDAVQVAAGQADPAAVVDADWLASTWAVAPLPVGWQPLVLTGGAPGSGRTAARMWISPAGFTPVDGAALRVGDARFDTAVDCAVALEPQVHSSIPAELGAILSTIKAMESGGDYTVAAATSTASGAYQFVDSSWGGYGGYARAKDAPPAVQDAKAAELAASILARNGGDVSTVPVSWYLGHVPVGGEWDTVPAYPGNRLTPREYQDRWMKRYAQLLGSPEAWVGSAPAPWRPVETTVTCRTVVVDVGRPGSPQYVLTQGQAFDADTSGRAVPRAVDPCDPARAVLATPPVHESPIVPVSGPS